MYVAHFEISRECDIALITAFQTQLICLKFFMNLSFHSAQHEVYEYKSLPGMCGNRIDENLINGPSIPISQPTKI